MISGDYTGWNSGSVQDGWGGMLLTTLLVATMYLYMCFSLTELSSTTLTADGSYGFTRSAFGFQGGFLTDTAILTKYIIAPAAIACFIDAYCESLFGVGGWLVYLMFYTVFIGIHILGTDGALKPMLAIAAVATTTLGVFIVAMLSHFDSVNLFNIPQTTTTGTNGLLPLDYVKIQAAISYTIRFFLAVEGVPLAAEETRSSKRNLSRELIGTILVFLTFTALILVVGSEAAGAKEPMGSDNPLTEASESTHKDSTWMSQLVSLIGLVGLTTSFFSVIYAYP